MNEVEITREDLFSRLPMVWPEDLMPEIQRRVTADGRKIAVVDDDPLGTQTVHDVPVLTDWSEETLRDELTSDYPAFFLLTNSRSMSPSEAEVVNAQVGRNLAEASRRTGKGFSVISRSDSTLRGHFPGEVRALAHALDEDLHAWIIIPFFPEGGRYTVDDIHCVAEGDTLVPVGNTEFARDQAFGYRSSNLREWVEEKTGGRIPAASVVSVSIEDVRLGGPERVAESLTGLRHGSVCVVNSAEMRDLEVFTLGTLMAEECGRRFLFRSASSFAKVRMGLAPRPLLSDDEIGLPEGGGALIVVGSHVSRTTVQLEALLNLPEVEGIEASVDALIDDVRSGPEIERVAGHADRLLGAGRHAVIYTSRRLASSQDMEESLAIGRRISQGLVSVVRRIETRPRHIIAKGGITASDIATDSLGVRRALVLGQIIPGVPVWRLASESRHPGLAYIVFPGNVGEAQALAELVKRL